MRRRFAHYGACCGVKPFSVKTEGRPQFNSNNPADMLSDFVFSCLKILDVILRTSTLSYLWYIFVKCEFLCVLSFQVYKNICMKTLTKTME